MRLGLISDLHWMLEPPDAGIAWHGGSAEFTAVLDRLRLALDHFAEQEVDLVALTGDLAHYGDDDALAQVLSACARASAPVLVVAGNHDLAEDPLRVERAISSAGEDGVSLASLAGAPHADTRVAGVHVGSTHGWFGARLQALPDMGTWGSDPVVLISHYPLLSLAKLLSDNGFPYPGDLLDRREIAALLGARPAATIVVGGHVHARVATTAGPVLQLTCAAMVEPPYECYVIDVEERSEGTLAVRRASVRLRSGGTGREPVFSPAREEWTFDGARWSATSPAASLSPAAASR